MDDIDEKKVDEVEITTLIPFELDYRLPEKKMRDPYYNMELDMDKVNYNEYYKSEEFFNSKFSGDPSNIPGWEKIIENMIRNSKYPVEGWIYRQQQQNKNENDMYRDEPELNTDIFKLEDSIEIQ